MLQTKITEMLGIKYPIIQGGMQWLGVPQFASAVSNAGALGIINAFSCESVDDLRAQIKATKNLTDKPFGVNVSMLPALGSDEIYTNFFKVIAEEKVKVVETSGKNPAPYIPILKDAGVLVMHKVPAVRFAKKAEAVGADMVTIFGFEGGGHPGMDDVSSLILVQKTAILVKIPVLAAGGFGTGRALVAALALGAEGIVMGTRFMATKECAIHENFKNWMAQAQETDTILIDRSIKNPARIINNKIAKEVLALEKKFELENKQMTIADLLPYIAGSFGKEAYLSGDLDKGAIACGQTVGLIDNVPTVQELIENMMQEAEEVISKLSELNKNKILNS